MRRTATKFIEHARQIGLGRARPWNSQQEKAVCGFGRVWLVLIGKELQTAERARLSKWPFAQLAAATHQTSSVL